MKLLIKKPGEKAVILPVPQNLILPTVNGYLKKKDLPLVTAPELAKLISGVEKVKTPGEPYILADIRKKDGSVIKIVM